MSKLWFGEWWPLLAGWTAAWVAVLASLALLVRLGLRELRAKRLTELDLTQGICVYLDESVITDQFQMGRHSEALTKEVWHRISKGGSAQAELPGVPVGFGLERADEMLTYYVQRHAPVEVIGVLLKVIEENHGIVRANLRTGTVVRNLALVKLLTDLGRSDPVPASTLLSHAEEYVLIKGRFRPAARTSDDPAGTTVFIAPYSGARTPAPAAHVRVVCENSGLRGKRPAEEFSGRCLGKVRGWNAGDGALDIHPVAIFQ
ncbi:hypothetical protein GCM10009639_45500 [Kitasatospora putterlickiae]|uniref:Uncharacterized protein n=1 Tax=Kitasatospora putterlickiae TaxID=221725 RepID=A0ABP4J0X6_9ACTN